MRIRTLAPLALLTVLASGTAMSGPKVHRVIPAEEAPRIGALLGLGAGPVGGCVLDAASVEKTAVAATYTCGDTTASLRLVHPDVAESPLARTGQFAIVAAGAAPPAELVDALASRLREQEGDGIWKDVVPGVGGQQSGAFAPSAATEAPHEASPADQDAYRKAMELYTSGKPREAMPILRDIASRTPRGVLGPLVAAIAAGHPTAEEVEQLSKEADAAPDDALVQFIAGVAAHYHGHQSGSSREDKSRWYGVALRHLERTLPALDFEPRVWIYLAVSHFRTGHQEEAEAAIAKAVERGIWDADAYYCRAEIMHKKDPDAAVADMKHYLKMMEENRKRGTFASEAKEKRVADMLRHMERVAAGELPPDQKEIFDPVRSFGPTGEPMVATLPATSTIVGAIAGLAVLVGSAFWWRRRRRR